MRAASADRERAVDVLKAGFAEGRLSQEEYDERMGRAYAARTYGELGALTADLPAGALPRRPGRDTVPARLPRRPPGTNSMAIAAMVLGAAEVFTSGLTAIPAVICGHVARKQIRQTTQSGDGLATGGLVLGYMAIIFWTVLIVGLAGRRHDVGHTQRPGGHPEFGSGGWRGDTVFRRPPEAPQTAAPLALLAPLTRLNPIEASAGG